MASKYLRMSSAVAWFSTYPRFAITRAVSVVLTARWCRNDGVFNSGSATSSSSSSLSPSALIPAYRASSVWLTVGAGSSQGSCGSSRCYMLKMKHELYFKLKNSHTMHRPRQHSHEIYNIWRIQHLQANWSSDRSFIGRFLFFRNWVHYAQNQCDY